MEFSDDWAAAHGQNVAIRANGKKVEVYKGSSWFTEKICGAEIETLLWLPNGKVEAVLNNGKVVYAGLLTPNPKKNYPQRKIEIQEPEQQSSVYESRSESKRSRRSSDNGNDSDLLEKILLFPFKLIWWIIKGIWKSF